MSFQSDIELFCDFSVNALNNLITDVIDEVSSEVIYRTPVDTGRARSNWILGINKMNLSSEWGSYDPIGNDTLKRIINSLPSYKIGNIYFVSNSIEYIGELEQGKSWSQAPFGILKMAELSFDKILNRVVARYVQ